MTAILTIGLGAWAWTTKRNLSFLGPILFIGLLAVIVASIFSLFLATGPLSFIIALVSVVLFSGFIVYDVQRIKFTEDTLSAAIAADRQSLSRYPEPVPELAPPVRWQRRSITRHSQTHLSYLTARVHLSALCCDQDRRRLDLESLHSLLSMKKKGMQDLVVTLSESKL